MSSKIEFDRESLKTAIIQAHWYKIERAEKILRELDDEELFRNRLDEWRAKQCKRILDLADRIQSKEYEDAELEGFEIPSAPRRLGKYDRGRIEDGVDAAKRRMDKALKRFDALPVRETYLATAKQLEDYFGI